jgi:chemotaxis protein CheD
MHASPIEVQMTQSALNLVTVDISELRVSSDPAVVLVTYALGSCIAVMIHDPARLVAGMIHYMLPLSDLSPEKAIERPAMFADTGIPLLFKSMYSLGCEKKNLVVKVAGGSLPHTDQDAFQIGRRNYIRLRKLLRRNNVPITAEDVGGSLARTAYLYVGSGRVVIKCQGEELEL